MGETITQNQILMPYLLRKNVTVQVLCHLGVVIFCQKSINNGSGRACSARNVEQARPLQIILYRSYDKE